MGIGVCVTLMAVGAILTFATDWWLAGVDLDVVGVIFMVTGALGLAVTVQIFRPRSRPAAPPQPYHQQQQGGYYPPAGQPPQYSQHPQPPPYPPSRGDGYR